MAQLNPKEMQQALAKPFAPEDLEWRLQNTIEEKMRGLAVPYVTNRAIQNRLDEVCGPENWYNDFKPWHSNGKKEAQLCGIAIYFEGRGFITKWDGAEDSDIEAVKGGLSDSMKRAAVQWGIGRVLYDLNTVWVEIEKRGRSFVIKDSERARLDNAYLSALKRLGLTPAAACGIQSLLTPKTLPGQTAPEENAPAASPQPKQGNSQPAPASALQRADQPATRSDSQQTQPVQQSRAAASRTVPFALPQSAARQRTDSEHQGTGRYERQQHACYAPSAGRQADSGLRPRRTARTERRHRSEQCKAHHASAGYRGILCVGILRDRPARGQGGINSDSAKNGKEQFFEKDRAVSNYQPDAFGLQVL